MNSNDITNYIIKYIYFDSIYSFSLINIYHNDVFNQYIKTDKFEKEYIDYVNGIIKFYNGKYTKSSEIFYGKFHNKFQKKVYINWEIYFKFSIKEHINYLYAIIFNNNLTNKCIDFIKLYEKTYGINWFFIIKNNKLNNESLSFFINLLKKRNI